MNLTIDGWGKSSIVKDFEETKRFIAVFVDNLRTRSESRIQYIFRSKEGSGEKNDSQIRKYVLNHKDWFSIYIRNQNK